MKNFNFRLPYIVRSRANRNLLESLIKDEYPILLEGIHCTYYLFNGVLNKRKVFVRLHNVEFEYYKRLAKTTRSPFKKIFFRIESSLLKKYEAALAKRAHYIAVSERDVKIYREAFDAHYIEYLPVFLPFCEVRSETGTGDFCLYHGNLSVPENERVAMWLIEQVFSQIALPLVIAGKNPTQRLSKSAGSRENVCLVPNPPVNDLDDLIKKAQLHLVPSLNATGIKIKLLHALFYGRYVITNQVAVENSGLEPLCEMAECPNTFTAAIDRLSEKPFTEKDILARKQVLDDLFNTDKNVERLIRWLW